MRKLIFMTTGLLMLLPAFAYSDAAEEGLKVGDYAPEFTLEDARGKSYALKEMKGNYVFLLFSNRNFKNENRKYAKALKDYYAEQTNVKIFMIADLRGIPFFITRSFIKERIAKENLPVPLLLDWEQKVNNLYGTDPKKINVIVTDTTGKIILWEKCGNYDQETIKILQIKLEPDSGGQ